MIQRVFSYAPINVIRGGGDFDKAFMPEGVALGF